MSVFVHAHPFPVLRLTGSIALAAALGACGGGGTVGSGGGGSGAGQCGGYLQPPCSGGGGGFGGGGGGQYVANALVSDSGAGALHADADLVNAWGLAFNPGGYGWVSDEATGVSTLYDGNGVAQSPTVTLPTGAAPTGIVYNGTAGFSFTFDGQSGPPLFLWDTIDGTIAAWAPDIAATQAVTVVDNSGTGAVYTGLAIGVDANQAPLLFAANFGAGRVDVFDAGFQDVSPVGGFVDPAVPAGYAPFGIQQIGGNIYVAWAQVDPASGREVHAAGAGVLDAFDPAGHLLATLVAAGGALDAPWGIALAPSNFGPQSNQLVVGNFGDGTLHAYSPTTGALAGQIMNDDQSPIVIDGLWGIAFGNGLATQPTNTLFYAAGPGGGAHGTYGRIDLD
ncbi:MAG TPA: TIGR03118 family protein [Burkholderiaceae bacterium]|jgi:uncharacterized protein (TIGR03118 family)|nr:TIGR03118 family protein [Burkholderiaceae bacterium]